MAVSLVQIAVWKKGECTNPSYGGCIQYQTLQLWGTGAVRYPRNDQVVSSTSQSNSVKKKANNQENEQYPLIFKAKKKKFWL